MVPLSPVVLSPGVRFFRDAVAQQIHSKSEMTEVVPVSGAVQVPAWTAVPVRGGGELASRPSGDPWGYGAAQAEERRGKHSSPLSSKHRGAVEVSGPSPLSSLLEIGLEAAENKWTLT